MTPAPHPPRASILAGQLARLRALLAAVIPANPFQTRKLGSCAGELGAVNSLAGFSRLAPFTSKQELVADQLEHPPYGTNLTAAIASYTRCHQTSGTTGTPLRWLDTPESWAGMVENWMEVFRAAGLTREDKVLFAFSFGPFIGFWLAFEAAERLESLCLAGGGLSSPARLRLLLDHGATVLCCTPTYALRLAEVAVSEEIDMERSRVRLLVLAGEPGGSIPATRARLERLWRGARVFDHHGMTEVGPVTYQCPATPGRLHVIESAYYAEIIDPATGCAVPSGSTGELVLTTLGRTGSPLLRYRTGDLVRPRFDPASNAAPVCECGRGELALDGGILGRVDDMVIVRGVNVFPSAVEEILRGFGEVAEYQVTLDQSEGLTEMAVRVEPNSLCSDLGGLARRIEQSFQIGFSLRVPVLAVPPGSLPRFEMKAKRWVRMRGPSG